MDLSTLKELDRARFLTAATAERALLCERLGDELSRLLKDAPDFHHAVIEAVAELRRLGHDLWSFDEEDEFEVWVPDYANPTGPGISVTFRADGKTDVGWARGD